jgi:hypothetical protein
MVSRPGREMPGYVDFGNKFLVTGWMHPGVDGVTGGLTACPQPISFGNK